MLEFGRLLKGINWCFRPQERDIHTFSAVFNGANLSPLVASISMARFSLKFILLISKACVATAFSALVEVTWAFTRAGGYTSQCIRDLPIYTYN